MKTIATWLENLKVEKPDLKETIAKFETHFSESGFNDTELMSMLDIELKQIETNLSTSLKNSINA